MRGTCLVHGCLELICFRRSPRLFFATNDLLRIVSKRFRLNGHEMAAKPSYAQAPQFVLFGDSLTEWGFDEHNEGFGWFLERQYGDKVDIKNEGV